MTTYRPQASGIPIIDKSPTAVLDYSFDWAAAAPDGPWLEEGETIASNVVTVATGLTLVTTIMTPHGAENMVTVWLSGGTIGTTYLVQCEVITSMGRTDTRSFKARVIQR